MPRTFRPGLGPTVTMLVAVALFAALGKWQVDRRQWRNADLAAKNAKIDEPPLPLARFLADPSALAWRRVTATGRFDRARSIVIGPDVREDRRGARVFTPLVLEGAAPDAPRLLVDRGWIPSSEIARFGANDAPSGDEPSRTLTGLAFQLAVGGAQPGPADLPAGVTVQTFAQFDPTKPLQAAALQEALPYPLLPVLLQWEGDGSDRLPIGTLSRPVSPVNHLGYALFWFGLAGGAVATWIALGRERARVQARAAGSVAVPRPS
ncbi:MAG TPA: SURF1 family protein [Myxococcota bacterium]|jgi:cytochrome oxidase assembly protein ShyY1|nr:SURF1 family protein [Myxococcota bacterium]